MPVDKLIGPKNIAKMLGASLGFETMSATFCSADAYSTLFVSRAM